MPEYICPHCTIRLSNLTNFCGNCGGKLPELLPVERRCQNCQAEIDMSGRLGGPNYCENCGAVLHV